MGKSRLHLLMSLSRSLSFVDDIDAVVREISNDALGDILRDQGFIDSCSSMFHEADVLHTDNLTRRNLLPALHRMWRLFQCSAPPPTKKDCEVVLSIFNEQGGDTRLLSEHEFIALCKFLLLLFEASQRSDPEEHAAAQHALQQLHAEDYFPPGTLWRDYDVTAWFNPGETKEAFAIRRAHAEERKMEDRVAAAVDILRWLQWRRVTRAAEYGAAAAPQEEAADAAVAEEAAASREDEGVGSAAATVDQGCEAAEDVGDEAEAADEGGLSGGDEAGALQRAEMASRVAAEARQHAAEVEAERAENLRLEMEALELKFSLATQRGAESSMRNVAKRMLHQEVARCLITWGGNYADQKKSSARQANYDASGRALGESRFERLVLHVARGARGVHEAAGGKDHAACRRPLAQRGPCRDLGGVAQELQRWHLGHVAKPCNEAAVRDRYPANEVQLYDRPADRPDGRTVCGPSGRARGVWAPRGARAARDGARQHPRVAARARRGNTRRLRYLFRGQRGKAATMAFADQERRECASVLPRTRHAHGKRLARRVLGRG